MRRKQNAQLTTGLLVALSVIMTINPIVANTYLPGLARMAADLGTSIAGIQVALTAFLLGVSVGQLIVGALSDALGRRGVLVASFALLAVAGVVVAAAPTLTVMVIGRVAQGLAAAAGVVVVRAVIADLATGPAAARGFSLVTGAATAGPLLASFLGTVLLQVGGWRATLVGVVGASLLYLVVAAIAVPESLAPARRSPLRLPRMAAAYGRLLRDAGYVGHAFTMAFAFAALTVHVSASSFVIQGVLGADPWGFWLLFSAYALAVFSGASLNAPLSARFGPRRMLAIALSAAVASTAGMLVATLAGFTVAAYLPLIVIAAASLSACMANATTLTLGRSRASAGSGAALMGCLQFAVAALASPIGGLAGPDTATPMAAGMLGCVALAVTARLVSRRVERREGLPQNENPAAPADPASAP